MSDYDTIWVFLMYVIQHVNFTLQSQFHLVDLWHTHLDFQNFLNCKGSKICLRIISLKNLSGKFILKPYENENNQLLVKPL